MSRGRNHQGQISGKKSLRYSKVHIVATLNMGILGGFSGAVGTVIGTTNKKGEDIIRVKSKKSRGPASQSQQQQQTRFGIITGFLSPLNFLIKDSFKRVAGFYMSPFNYACQEALKNAFGENADNTTADFSKIAISKGQLSRERSVSGKLENQQVTFTWSDTSDQGKCTGDDKATLVVYNVTQGEISYSQGVITRDSKSATLDIPYAESGDTLLFYIYFQSSTDEDLYSGSQLAGTVVIA